MTSFQQVKTYNEQTNRYRRLLLEQPTALEPRVKLAEAHIEIGDRAEQAILRAIDLEPSDTAYKDRLNEIQQAMEGTKKQ